MMIRWLRFNPYLPIVIALIALCGCRTAEGKKKHVVSSFRLHQEMNADPSGRTEQISVYRQHPVTFTVDRQPFLTENHVKEAKVIDTVGGFSLSVQLDRQGSWLLEEYSAASRSRHIAIFCQFTNPNEEKINQGRWLAAPLIHTHITDGLIVFTPDATRQEAEQIVLGLNNVAKKMQDNEPN